MAMPYSHGTKGVNTPIMALDAAQKCYWTEIMGESIEIAVAVPASVAPWSYIM